MSSNQIRSAEEIYRAALNVSEAERNFFIWEQCANNSDLYSEVQVLFALHRKDASEKETLVYNTDEYNANVNTSPQSERETLDFKTKVSDLPQTEYAPLTADVQQVSYSKPANFVAQQVSAEEVKKPVNKVLLLAPLALLFGVLIIATTVILIAKFKPDSTTKPDSPKRTLAFWLTVRMCKDSVNWCRDNSTAVFGNPIKSTGEQIFSNGSKISFHAASPQTGYLYIVIEGQGENDSVKWTAVFPNPKDNGGVSRIDANQELKTIELSADSNTGTENLWIVWSESQIDELENLFKSEIDKNNGTFIQSSHERLKNFLNDASSSKVKSEIIESPSPQIILRGNDEVFILQKKIKHENY